MCSSDLRWLRSWAVNFHAPFVLSQLVLADMIARRSGAIVNISSGAAIGPGRGPYLDPSVGTRGGTCYGAEKAALERFTQGLASEVYQHGVSVTCVSPSQIVPTPGTVHHRLVKSLDDPRGEAPILMAKAALLLATEPVEKVSGRVTYSQQILKEFGWITDGRGRGVESRGSGYSEIWARRSRRVSRAQAGATEAERPAPRRLDRRDRFRRAELVLRCHAATSRIVRVALAVAHLSHGPRVLWSVTARQGERVR